MNKTDIFQDAYIAEHYMYNTTLLVMIGVLTNGQKVVLAVESGQRESKESWGMMLRDLRKRGLKPWRCTIADGHLGLWAALGEQYPQLAEQRC